MGIFFYPFFLSSRAEHPLFSGHFAAFPRGEYTAGAKKLDKTGEQ